MKQVKFRAWIKSGFDDDVKPYMAEVDEIRLTGFDVDRGIKADDNEWSFDDVILMQFTGLLDKNGKEIYEGDIVRLQNYPGDWVVEWTNVLGRAGFTLRRILDDCPATIRSGGKEVIGNIHENPELLNK